MDTEIKKAFETFLPIFEFGLQKMTGSERWKSNFLQIDNISVYL